MQIKPISFTAAMSARILSGDKTQTRRLITPQPASIGDKIEAVLKYRVGDLLWVREPYYQFGHWEPVAGVKTKGGRQKWSFVADCDEVRFDLGGHPYRKSNDRAGADDGWWYARLARFMPRALSRTTLEVTEVRVQRLKDISEADAIAEGVMVDRWASIIPYLEDPADAGTYALDTRVYWAPGDDSEDGICFSATDAFLRIWAAINGEDSYEENPWVAAYSFRPIFQNVDAVLKERGHA